MKYRRNCSEANQGYHRQQAHDLLKSMSREDAIEFCLIQDWQGILNIGAVPDNTLMCYKDSYEEEQIKQGSSI